MTDHHEPDIEKIVREGAREGGRDAKISYLDRRLVLIYVFVVLMCALVAWYGNHKLIAFQRANLSECQSTAQIVDTWDGYVAGQVRLIQSRKDIPPAVKAATITNYQSHLLRTPDCSKLIP